MSKRTLVRTDNKSLISEINNQLTFSRARNNLVAAAKKHVKVNGLRNDILGTLSKNDYVNNGQSLYKGKKNFLLRGKSYGSGQSESMKPDSMSSDSMSSDSMPSDSMPSHNRTKIFSRSSLNNANANANANASIRNESSIQAINTVDIFAPTFIASVVNTLVNILTEFGVQVNIFYRHLNNTDIGRCTNDNGRFLFIFAPQLLLQAKHEQTYPSNLKPLPTRKYFLYQIADLSRKNPRNSNPHILELIKNSKHTFDCSVANMRYYTIDCNVNVSALDTQSDIQSKKLIVNIKMLYPSLFHKYVLDLRNPYDNSLTNNYSTIKESSITRKNICHIHCFYLKNLFSMFDSYLSLISQTFDIIVTYTHIDDSLLNKYNYITFLKVNNYGMDIGPKFTVYEYLRNKNIDYNYVFYLHSKTDGNRRNKYLTPFINNMASIDLKINENNSNISCYFNDILSFGDNIHVKTHYWDNNKCYMTDILGYLQIKQYKNETMFEEGNFYILHKQIIDKLFSNKLLYNILNTENSFDYNWVNKYYKLNSNNSRDVYNKYRQNRLFGNNIQTKKGHDGLADAMIEHVFERLPIIMCKEHGLSITILDSICSKTIFSGNKIQKINTSVKEQKPIEQNPIEQKQIIHTNLSTSSKTLCIVACHTSSDLKIKCLKHNMKYFEEITNDIVYINSTEFAGENVIDNMIYINNDTTVCYGKYLHVLQNMDIGKYDNIILTNDSYLITKSLSGFKSLFTDSIEMTSLCCSNETARHYPDFLRRYNKVGIQKIIQFYKSNLSNNKSFLSLIGNIEVKCHIIHNNSINVLFDSIPGYIGNIHIDNTQLKEYLYNKNYPIIKIKKLQFTTYNNRQLPTDFNPIEYRRLNPDLREFNNNDAKNHFINYGMAEGRTYKINQQLIHPEFLTQYVNKIIAYMKIL
jgi:hypothetical protein